uniref:Protein kinase domain-containing protein n=1 Tax=Megaselia scalaris TaxID=36166 RepID=T1H4H0_MEGSC
TQIQYESLEGSIILNNPEDDTLYEKIGCPLYTAPELLTPNSTFQGKPADMWSLGVILFTMLLGQYPFNEKNGHSLFINIRNHNIVIPNALSGKVRCLIRSLLRRNPEERLIADDIFYHPWLKSAGKVRCLIRSLLRRNPEERLIADDIFYHPWLKSAPKSVQFLEQKYDVDMDDHCVPEMPSMECDDDVEMG